MKKKQFISILLVSLICILPILCILMVHHITLCNTIQKMGDGVFGEKSCLISLSNNSSLMREELYDCLIESESSVAIYMDDVFHENCVVRYMAFTDKYMNLPMISGSFFRKEDFKKNNDVAVIGKSVTGTYEKDGNEYIDVAGKTYSVVGIMGYEEDTEFDNYIFINLFAAEDETLNLYILDFLSNEECGEIVERCSYEMKEKMCELKIMSETEQFQDRLKVSFDTIKYFLGLLFSYILCILLISYQWILAQRRDIGIRRLLGASKKQISTQLIVRYLGYILGSFLVGYIYCKIGYPSYIESFYKGFVISVGILMLFMILTVSRFLMDSIEEVIK